MKALAGKTVFITGASRGIGLAIAIRVARDGANVAIAAKTATPHAKLDGTIFTAAKQVESAGGRALPVIVDVRDEHAIANAVAEAVLVFGGIDVCINNASAIDLRGTEAITPSRFDLLQRVNSRGTFLSSRACLPHLRKATNPHVLTLSPPLNLRPEWFGAHFAYTLSKYSMSLCTLGLSAEFKGEGIAFNSLWPRTMIATSAVEVNFGGPDALRQSRTAEIMADAAYAIVTRPARDCTGRFFIDDEVLREDGVTDLSRYAFARGEPLRTDLFIDSATLA